MNQELFNRGHRNIEDAYFVRDIFIPSAFEKQKWNIVVYEAYRVVELVVKGIMCLAGIPPILENQAKYTHNIKKLIILFQNELSKVNGRVPYFLALKSPSSDNHYGIEIIGNKAYLYIYVAGLSTELQSPIDLSSISVDGLINLNFHYEDNTLTLIHNNKTLTLHTDATFGADKLKFEMGFQRIPDNERVNKIAEIGELLLKNRTAAFYSERIYSKEDALTALDNMNEALEASKAFFSSYEAQ